MSGISAQGLFAVVVWGSSFVATRMALEAFNPFALVAVRFLVGTAMLGLVIHGRGGWALPARRDVPMCLFLGAVLGAHLLIQAYGLRYTSAIKTGWIVGFMPVTIALGAWLLDRQEISRVGWTGVGAGTAGIVLVWLSSSPDFAHARFGDLLQMLSCLTWTVYTLASGGPVARNGVLRVTAFGMGVAAGLAALPMIWLGVWSGPVSVRAVLAVAFLGLICSGVAYYMWFAAVRDHGPARVGALLYVEPFVALATGALIMREHVTLRVVGGGFVVLLGVWLVTRGSRKPGAVAAERVAPGPARVQDELV